MGGHCSVRMQPLRFLALPLSPTVKRALAGAFQPAPALRGTDGAQEANSPFPPHWPSKPGPGRKGLAVGCHASLLLVAPPEGCATAGGGLLVLGAGKETWPQCSCENSHFIDRKGPGPSAQLGAGWV